MTGTAAGEKLCLRENQTEQRVVACGRGWRLVAPRCDGLVSLLPGDFRCRRFRPMVGSEFLRGFCRGSSWGFEGGQWFGLLLST